MLPVDKLNPLSSESEMPLGPRARGVQVPITCMQRVLLGSFPRRDDFSGSYRMSASSLRVLGPLDISLLRSVLNMVFERHESLRTRITITNDAAHQTMDPSKQFPLTLVDLTNLRSRESRETEASRLASEFLGQTIDLTVGPVCEAYLLRFSSDEHALVVVLDHVVSDRVSCAILEYEIWASYHQTLNHMPISLAALTVQFGDYAVWECQTYPSWSKLHGSYWRTYLKGVRHTKVEFSELIPELRAPTTANVHIPFGKKLTQNIRVLARREHCLLPMVVLTVYAAVLAEWLQRDEITVAFLTDGRQGDAALRPMIGFLASPIHLRIKLPPRDTSTELLHRIHQDFSAAFRHLDRGRMLDLLPGFATDLVINWFSAERLRTGAERVSQSHNQVILKEFAVRFPDRRLAQIIPPPGWPKVFLTVFCETPAGITMAVGYRTDMVPADMVERFGHTLRQRIAAFIDNPGISLAALGRPG